MSNDDQVLTLQTIPDQLVSDTAGNQSTLLLELENLIKNHLVQIDTLRQEVRDHKEMLGNILANDPTYQKHQEAAQQAAKVKAATRAQLLKGAQAGQLADEIRTKTASGKELQTALSEYLGEYQRLSGLSEIEGPDGEMRKIVYIAKLVKSSSGLR